MSVFLLLLPIPMLDSDHVLIHTPGWWARLEFMPMVLQMRMITIRLPLLLLSAKGHKVELLWHGHHLCRERRPKIAFSRVERSTGIAEYREGRRCWRVIEMMKLLL